jgi:hypothetical protein
MPDCSLSAFRYLVVSNCRGVTVQAEALRFFSMVDSRSYINKPLRRIRVQEDLGYPSRVVFSCPIGGRTPLHLLAGFDPQLPGLFCPQIDNSESKASLKGYPFTSINTVHPLLFRSSLTRLHPEKKHSDAVDFIHFREGDGLNSSNAKAGNVPLLAPTMDAWLDQRTICDRIGWSRFVFGNENVKMRGR